jgi:hypothetical protein
MSNDWFTYEEKSAETISAFVNLVLDAPYLYLYRGHADLNWELEPVIDRSDFSGRNITREDHERLVLHGIQEACPTPSSLAPDE